MPKYIVDGPKVNPGEKLSSGGVRKDGKMVEQFKNPRLYKEPDPQVIYIDHSNETLTFAEEHPILASFASELHDLAAEVWYTELKPYIKMMIINKIHNYLESKDKKKMIQPINICREQHEHFLQEQGVNSKITQFPRAI